MIKTETIGGQAVQQDSNALFQALLEAKNQGNSWDIAHWEQYLNTINPDHMALGLDRVREVAFRLHLFEDLVNNGTYIVSVAGTNGKGSTCALIAQTMSNLDVNVGMFTSPHLKSFTERIQLNGEKIEDQLLAKCFSEVVAAQFPDAQIEALIDPQEENFAQFKDEDFEDDSSLSSDERIMAIAELNQATRAQELGAPRLMANKRPLKDEVIELTYFEIATLAAVRAFMYQRCELLVLEVGLGGRLDAVNIFYNDIAVITSIGKDHMKILGDSSTQIAHEKAGIIKPYGEVVVGKNIDEDARLEILTVAKTNDAKTYLEDFAFKVDVVAKTDCEGKSFAQSHEICYQDKAVSFALYFPYPKVPVSCVGIALNVIFKLIDALGFKNNFETLSAIEDAVANVCLPGRMQLASYQPNIYLDVAHNEPAAAHLKAHLGTYLSSKGRKVAVIAMLKDKDIEGVLATLKDSFDAFYVATLNTARGESQERLYNYLNDHVDHEKVQLYKCDTVAKAIDQAQHDCACEDTIIVMGSFVTVSEASDFLHVNQ